MKLTRFPETRYTMMELHLFDRLPKNGRKFDSADIVEWRKAMGDWDVRFPLKNVTVTMNNLIQKIDDNGEPFQLRKDGKRTGHHKVEYWLEPRIEKKRKANGK